MLIEHLRPHVLGANSHYKSGLSQELLIILLLRNWRWFYDVHSNPRFVPLDAIMLACCTNGVSEVGNLFESPFFSNYK